MAPGVPLGSLCLAAPRTRPSAPFHVGCASAVVAAFTCSAVVGGGGTEEGEVAAAAPRGRGERSSAPPPTPSPRAPLASCAGGAD